METNPWAIFLPVIWIHTAVHGGELQTYKADEFCGYTVSRYDSVGQLSMDVGSLSARRSFDRTCRITVAPEALPGSNRKGRILLYFTKFDLPAACSDFNVSVTDDSWSSVPVAGLPHVLCGQNSTLTGANAVFNTSGSEFIVTIRWRTFTSFPSGGFLLKFAAFYDGPCSESSEVVTCVNTRCTDSAFHCHVNISTCGLEEEDACNLDDSDFLESLQKWIVKSIKDLAILVAVIVGIYLALRILKMLYKKHGDNCFKTRQARSPDNLRLQSASASVVEVNVQTDVTEPSELRRSIILDDTDDVSSDETESGGLTRNVSRDPPAYDALSPPPSAPPPPAPTPSVPPPSYDEVISNSDVYKH